MAKQHATKTNSINVNIQNATDKTRADISLW